MTDNTPEEFSAARKFELLMKEKEFRQGEMLDYNKRLDRTVVLYLSAAYAALGLQVSEKLDLSLGIAKDSYALLVLLFIFLNGCIILHAMAQSCWCMSTAQYIHVRLDAELLKLIGEPVRANGSNRKLRHVHWLAWDDWRDETKGVGNNTRNAVTTLWMFFVILTSVYSLTYANMTRFFNHFPFVTIVAAIVLLAMYIYAAFQGLTYFGHLGCYHDPEDFKPNKKPLWGTAIFALVLVGVSLCAASTHSLEDGDELNRRNNARVCCEKGAGAEPRNEAVSARAGN